MKLHTLDLFIHIMSKFVDKVHFTIYIFHKDKLLEHLFCYQL